jgi:hypothetical protein
MLEARVARLEADVAHIQRDLTAVQSDLMALIASVDEVKVHTATLVEAMKHVATWELTMWRLLGAFVALITAISVVVGAGVGYAPRIQALLGTAQQPAVIEAPTGAPSR